MTHKKTVLSFDEFIKNDSSKDIKIPKNYSIPGAREIKKEPAFTGADGTLSALGITESRRIIAESVTKETFKGLFESAYLTPIEKNALRIAITNNPHELSVLDENILDNIKKGWDKAKEIGVNVKDNVAQKIDKVITNAKAFAQYIADLFKQAFDKILGFFMKKYEPLKSKCLKAAQEGKIKIEKNQIKNEMTMLSDTVKFWLKEFPKKVYDAITGTFAKEIVKESFSDDRFINILAESTISDIKIKATEYFNNALDKIKHVPPFKQLHDIEHLAAHGAEKFLNNFSSFTKNMGGPGTYNFVAISAIFGIIVELYAKDKAGKMLNLVKGGIEEIVTSEWVLNMIPAAKLIVTSIGYVALLITVIEIIQLISKEVNKEDLQVDAVA
jgi:hypothetical protein